MLSSISFLTVISRPGELFIGVRGVASRFRFLGGGTASSTSTRETEDRVLRRAAEVARTILEVSWDILEVRMLTRGSSTWKGADIGL